MAYNKLNTFKLIENQSHGLKAFKCKFKSQYTLKHCGSMHSTTCVLSIRYQMSRYNICFPFSVKNLLPLQQGFNLTFVILVSHVMNVDSVKSYLMDLKRISLIFPIPSCLADKGRQIEKRKEQKGIETAILLFCMDDFSCQTFLVQSVLNLLGNVKSNKYKNGSGPCKMIIAMWLCRWNGRSSTYVIFFREPIILNDLAADIGSFSLR